MGDPPGGPPDTAPPAIVSVRPDSGALVPDLKGDAVIQFDEVIDEMAAGGGGGGGGAPAGLARQVILSPVVGDVQVSWHRSSIHVKPKEGWKRGRLYRLELLPGIVDLRRNKLDSGRVVLFSTGPAFRRTTLQGTVLQWVEQRALGRALVRALPLPDTAAYVTLADSAGDFRLADIPPGRYLVYAVADQNQNRLADRREPYDSSVVRLDSTAAVVLWTFVHDTVGPRARTAERADSVTIRLDFSQALAASVRLDTTRVRVRQLPDSSPVRLTAVWTATQYDSVTAAERAARPDTGAARRDTTEGVAARRDTAQGVAARVDTSRIRKLLGTRPVPSDKLFLRLSRPLVPETKYFIEVRGAVNLNGATADAQWVLTVPKPPPSPRNRTTPDTTRPARPRP